MHLGWKRRLNQAELGVVLELFGSLARSAKVAELDEDALGKLEHGQLGRSAGVYTLDLTTARKDLTGLGLVDGTACDAGQVERA